MATVADLLPGDEVTLPGAEVTGMFVTRDDHEAYPGLQLVVWALSDGTWSFDALLPRQHVGEITPSTRAQRQQRLMTALEARRLP